VTEQAPELSDVKERDVPADELQTGKHYIERLEDETVSPTSESRETPEPQFMAEVSEKRDGSISERSARPRLTFFSAQEHQVSPSLQPMTARRNAAEDIIHSLFAPAMWVE
jgi:hypothetical protein